MEYACYLYLVSLLIKLGLTLPSSTVFIFYLSPLLPVPLFPFLDLVFLEFHLILSIGILAVPFYIFKWFL